MLPSYKYAITPKGKRTVEVEIKVAKEDEGQIWIVKSYKGHTHLEKRICITVWTSEQTIKQNEKNHHL